MISVIIPAFNAVKTIGRAVTSVLAGDDGRISEIVIVDDCSTDETYNLARHLASTCGRITIHRNQRNLGPAAARNTAIGLARGHWIAILDSDDAWKPERLRSFDLNEKRAEAYADNLISYDVNANELTGHFYENYRPGLINIPDLLSKYRDDKPFDYGFLKPIVNKNFLTQNSLLYDANLRQGEDYVFLLDVALSGGRIELVDGCSYIYTTWMGEISRMKSPYSRTSPDGVLLSKSILKLQSKYELDKLTSSYVLKAAIKAEQSAPDWTFYHLLSNYDLKSLGYLVLRHPHLLEALYHEIVFLLKRRSSRLIASSRISRLPPK